MKRSTRVSAYGVCWTSDALLLVHQIAPGPACGLWTLPGGGVDFGEHPRDAVIREIREETGLKADVRSLLAVHDNVYATGDGVSRHGIRLLFSATVSGSLLPEQVEEIDQVKWHQAGSLPAGITAWAKLATELRT